MKLAFFFCTIHFVGIDTFDVDMPPPPLDFRGDEDMGKAQKGETHP